MGIVNKEDIKEIQKQVVKKLLGQNRIEDIKAISISCGKNNQDTLNQECLRVLEEKLSVQEYDTFYNNLKD